MDNQNEIDNGGEEMPEKNTVIEAITVRGGKIPGTFPKAHFEEANQNVTKV